MERADPNFEVGGCVKVKEGVKDPDSDADISGWQGRVREIAADESGRPLILVAWDSHTLKGMSRSYLEQSEVEGLDWQQFFLPAEDIEDAQRRDTQREVAEVAAEIGSDVYWYSLGEQGERIREVVSGAEGEWEEFKAWERCLEQSLKFPFEAVVSEYQERGRLRQGDRVRVSGISVLDDLYGVIVSGKRGRESIDFPLCDLEVVGGGVNERLVSDYSVWFANR